MDVKYVEKGRKGKTCADCQYLESTGAGMGKCFGHEVIAKGSCNMFEAKSSPKPAGNSSAKPRIFSKEAFLIAGVAGSGDETAKAWEVYMKLDKMNPLKNKMGEAGYEVRMYPAEGPGKIHVGVQVKDARVPKEYKVFFVPAATYAEFEIYPAKGYESSNDVMSKWLEDNAGTYKEGILDGMKYGIEVYDQRFKGNDNPESVVGFLVPIVPAISEDLMLKNR